MTEQTQSSADIATRALEEAKARLSPEEFRLFVYYFNAQYIVVRMQTAEGFDPSIINLFIGGLVEPLTYEHAEENGISEGRANDLRAEARAVVLEAFSAAVVPKEPDEAAPVYPGIYGLIIDRAHAEGFEAPTLEQIAAANINKPETLSIDWDAIYASERFHFQAALRRVIDSKPVHMKFMKKAEA